MGRGEHQIVVHEAQVEQTGRHHRVYDKIEP
jgi:hypothetical protein